MSKKLSLGKCLAAELRDTLRAYRVGPTGGERVRQIIWGVTGTGTFIGGTTADGFLDRAARILGGSGRVYKFGNSIVYERSGGTEPGLVPLTVQHRPEPHAAGVLANLLVLAVEGEGGV